MVIKSYKVITMPPIRKLTDDDVRFIRASYRSQSDLGELFGISQVAIWKVLHRETYRNVPDGAPGTPNNQYVIGDALDLLRALPDAYCPTIFTSPPYNKGQSHAATKGHNSNWPSSALLQEGYAVQSDDMPPSLYIRWQRELLTEMVRVAGPTGVVLYNHKFGQRDLQLDTRHAIVDGFAVRQIIIWDRGSSLNQGGAMMTQLPDTYEVIFVIPGAKWAVPNESKDLARRWGAVWRIPPEYGNNHPAPFPAELAYRAIALGTWRVLDPFAGSGTTALAAIQTGREWLAFDNSPEYRDMFAERQAELGRQARF